MNSSSQKRKLEEPQGTAKSSKNETSFMEKNVPEGFFSLGDDVFVYAATFKSSVSLHIRKFKKYREKFYPTTEGITLRPWWVPNILGRNTVPQENRKLQTLFSHELTIESSDFLKFKFTRLPQTDKLNPRSLILSAEQWGEMISQYNPIANNILDHVFEEMDFFSAYVSIAETPVAKNPLPESLDSSLGTQYLFKVLEFIICNIMKEKGLKQPEILAEELWGNKVEDFNALAFTIEIADIANAFQEKLWEEQNFLRMKPAMYVTEEFLKNVPLNEILRAAREKLCPPDAFEYFE